MMQAEPASECTRPTTVVDMYTARTHNMGRWRVRGTC